MAVNEDGFEIEVKSRRVHRKVGQPGEENPNAHLTNEQAASLRRMRALGWTHEDLATLYGITDGRSSEICRGRAYRDAGGPIEQDRTYNRSVARSVDHHTAEVRRLRALGWSERKIAAEIQMSKTFVHDVLQAIAAEDAEVAAA